jgi:hypothetical protein
VNDGALRQPTPEQRARDRGQAARGSCFVGEGRSDDLRHLNLLIIHVDGSPPPTTTQPVSTIRNGLRF